MIPPSACFLNSIDEEAVEFLKQVSVCVYLSLRSAASSTLSSPPPLPSLLPSLPLFSFLSFRQGLTPQLKRPWSSLFLKLCHCGRLQQPLNRQICPYLYLLKNISHSAVRIIFFQNMVLISPLSCLYNLIIGQDRKFKLFKRVHETFQGSPLISYRSLVARIIKYSTQPHIPGLSLRPSSILGLLHL